MITQYYKFLIVKLVSIIYHTMIYFIIGFTSAIMFNDLIPHISEKHEEEKTVGRLALECMIIFSLSGLLFYFLRKISKKISSPLDGMYGFDDSRLKELNGSVLLGAIFIQFQVKFLRKLKIIKNKINIIN